jgi:hypothetical protein
MKTITINIEDDFFSEDDELAYQEALKELENGETISLEELNSIIKN